MIKVISRLLGIFLMLAALAGILLSVVGTLFVWRIKPMAVEQVSNGVSFANRTATATRDLLDGVDSGLVQAQSGIESIDASLESLNKAISDLDPVLDTTSALIGEDLPLIIGDVQTSLASAVSTASTVDSTLRLVSAIPFVGISYAPAVPLSESIAQISDSLSPLPEKLVELQDGMDSTVRNLKSLQVEIQELNTTVQGLKTSLEDTHSAIIEYQDLLAEIESGLPGLEKRLRGYINTLTWAITIFMIWFFFLQVGLFTQGLEVFSQESYYFRHPLNPG
jgi:predicted PurR-regulated permease PerM